MRCGFFDRVMMLELSLAGVGQTLTMLPA